jgi:uncharacterized protein YjiS (DUF1127 family)
MATITQISSAPRHRRRVARILGLRQLWARWRDHASRRLYLADLDDRLLADIGLTRDACRHECEKPFWRS